jgi:hypothetical protein
MTIFLPFDNSAAARAALRHVTDTAHRRWAKGRVVLVLEAGQICVILRRVAGARIVAGRDVSMSYRLVRPGDLHAELTRLAATVPDPVFVSPLDLRQVSHWYGAVARSFLSGKIGPCVAVSPALSNSSQPRRLQRPRVQCAKPRWRPCANRAVGSAARRWDAARPEEA